MPFLVVQSTLLFDEDAEQADSGNDDHGDEAGQLPQDDGEEDETYETCADGTGGKGEKPPPDAHELQRLLQALEDRKAVERVVHSRMICVCVVALVLYRLSEFLSKKVWEPTLRSSRTLVPVTQFRGTARSLLAVDYHFYTMKNIFSRIVRDLIISK